MDSVLLQEAQSWLSHVVLLFMAVGIILFISKVFKLGTFDSSKNTNISPEERENLARSYGEEESKRLMKESREKKGKRACILMGVGIITTFLLPPVGLALMFFAIYQLTHASKSDYAEGKDEETLYKVNFLEPALNKVFPDGYDLQKGQCLNDDSVLSALPNMKNTPLKDFLQGHDLFSFTYKGVPMQFSHNHCEVYNGTDEDGHDEYKQVFDGQIYKANYKTRLSGYVRIIPTKHFLKHETVGDYKKMIEGREIKVETDNIYFNENFDVYATNQQDALFVLNPVVINYFTDYAKEGGRQALFVGRDSFVITRDNVFYNVFDKPVAYDDIDKLSVENKCNELAAIASDCYEMLHAINGHDAV